MYYTDIINTMHYYHYTYLLDNGDYHSVVQAFESDTQARANVFTWYINREYIKELWLFRYTEKEPAGARKLIDHLERPQTIKF